MNHYKIDKEGKVTKPKKKVGALAEIRQEHKRLQKDHHILVELLEKTKADKKQLKKENKILEEDKNHLQFIGNQLWEKHNQMEDDLKTLNKEKKIRDSNINIYRTNYDCAKDTRFKNVITSFKELWCNRDDAYDKDGNYIYGECSKCDSYYEILMNAFNTVEYLSGRDFDDFMPLDIYKATEFYWEDYEKANAKAYKFEEKYKELKSKTFINKIKRLFNYRLKLISKEQ